MRSMSIGLALSGGGALGGAHIGILDTLTQHRIAVSAIAGTSVGALIGVLYAAGGMTAIDGFLLELEKCGIIHPTPTHNPLLKTVDRTFAEIRQALNSQLVGRSFADLSMPFFCVATDIITGEMVILDSGDPVNAALASCAYPGVFPIQHVEDRFLIDGGLVRNLPSDLLRERGTEFIIGSSLYCISPLTDNQKRGRMSRLLVAARALEIIETTRASEQMAHCDFCFTPPMEVYRWFDFTRVEEFRSLGKEHAEERIPELQQRITEQYQKNNDVINGG